MPGAGEEHPAPACPGKHPLSPAPIPHPTRVLCHQIFGGLHDHRQQNLAWVEAQGLPRGLQGHNPMRTSASKSPRAFSRTSSKMPKTPDPTYLAPNDHCPWHKQLCRILPDAWRRQQRGVTLCFSCSPGGDRDARAPQGQPVPSGRAVAYGCTW